RRPGLAAESNLARGRLGPISGNPGSTFPKTEGRARRRAITCSPLRAARATRPSRAAGSRARRLDELVEDRALDPDEATVDAAAYARQAHDLDDVALDPGADRPVAHAEVGGGFLERQEPRGSGFAIHSTTWIAALHADARGHLACTWPGIRLDQVGAHGASP